MNYIFAAIVSNFSYAFADIGNGVVSKKNHPIRIAFWMTLIGTVVFSVPLLLLFRDQLHELTVQDLGIILAVDLFVNLGYFSFLMGMSRGSVTVTGVIGGSFPALTTVIALIFFHERVSPNQTIAILAVLTGVALSSMQGKSKNLLKELRASGTVYALGAFVFWGVYFALIRIPIARVGWFLPQYFSNIIGLVIFFFVAKFMTKNDETTRPKLLWVVALVAILQGAGSMFFNYAITQGNTSIVAPIAGSSPAVFALIAFFVFKDKLKRLQWLGLVLALLGIISLSIVS